MGRTVGPLLPAPLQSHAAAAAAAVTTVEVVAVVLVLGGHEDGDSLAAP